MTAGGAWTGRHVLVDGAVVAREAAAVSPLDRCLLYGLGAFETLRLWGGRPFLLERHRSRLVRSLGALGLPAPPALDELDDGLAALVEAERRPDALVRITVTGGIGPPEDESAGGGASPDAGALGMRVLVHLRPAPAPARPPVVVGVAPFAHDVRSPLAGVKSASYLVHYLLRERAEAEGRVDDLMVDADGRIAEGTVSTVFVVRGGELLTPPLTEGVLAGVTRGLVLELAEACGVPAREEPLRLTDLPAVDECFLTGAGKGLLPVDVVAGQALPPSRPVTDGLAAALAGRIAACCAVPAGRVVFREEAGRSRCDPTDTALR